VLLNNLITELTTTFIDFCSLLLKKFTIQTPLFIVKMFIQFSKPEESSL